VPCAHNGDKSKLTQKFVGTSHLYQVYTGDDWARTNDFVLSPDGQILTIKVAITSSKLSTPLTFVLTYKKAS